MGKTGASRRGNTCTPSGDQFIRFKMSVAGFVHLKRNLHTQRENFLRHGKTMNSGEVRGIPKVRVKSYDLRRTTDGEGI